MILVSNQRVYKPCMEARLFSAVESPRREPGGKEGRLPRRGVMSHLTFLDGGFPIRK